MNFRTVKRVDLRKNQKQREQKTSKKKKGIIREYAEAIVVAFLAAMVLRIFVIQAFRIPTGSMKDTLLIGDFLLVNKFIYGAKTPTRIPLLDIKIPSIRLPGFTQPKRGDIIVFKYPLDEKLDYIKRCIALEGDTVEVRNGTVLVNGKPEGESRFIGRKYDPEEGHYVNYYQITTEWGDKYVIRHYDNPYGRNDNFGPEIVPRGYLFMMGDNRDNSADSRTWGALPKENVLGQALVIYWSWDKNVPLYRIFNKIRWTRIGNLIR